MNKMKNKFIALLVVFTSIISFLPASFGGLVAKAADVPAEATDVRVNVDGTATPLTTRTDSNIKEEIYTTNSIETAFDITVENVQKTPSELIQQALDENKSITGVTKQEIVVLSINETKLVNDDGSENAVGKGVIDGMGIQIGYSSNDGSTSIGGPTPVQNDSQRIGVKITGLPAGVNKIKYAVKITTLGINYKKEIVNSDGSTTPEEATADPNGEKTYTAYVKDITIEHGKSYAISKISDMTFKAYVGDANKFSDDDTISDDTVNENNTVPFLYSTKADPDTNMALRYNFDVPDSLSSLKYIMTFGNMLDLDEGVELYKNGVKAVDGEDYTISGNSLTGDLSNPDKADLIVIKINSVPEDGSSTTKIAKAYAIEIRYNRLEANKDFSLEDAGITKLDFNDDESVKAYIGKAFTVTKNSAGFSVYKGEINIDSRARMISIDPKLIRSKDTVAYVVTNNYVDSSGTKRVKKSELKNGKQFVDFMASTSSNEIQVDVYEGKDGNVTDSSNPLARYLLNVNITTDNKFTMDLTFDSSKETYLRQPGVEGNIIEEFTTSRRTYDLCFGDPTVDPVGNPIDEPVTVSFTGDRSDKNEYIRVFLADDVDSTNLKEAEASVQNEYNNNSTDEDYLKRDTSINVNLGAAKKIVVQAYYDEFETKTINGVDEKVLVGSYPVGDKYVFYLPNNYDGSDEPTPGENSDNASLNSLKLKGYTLLDSDGNEGFSSDKFDYEATVAKEDTTAKITAIAEDDNVESIVATIDDGEESYDLVSGELSELPLNEKGKTTIEIVVTAQDGTTSKAYTIVIENNTKGSNVKLKNVILNVGDYEFDPTEDVTKVRVDQDVTSIKVTPIAEDSKAKISVDGQEFLESPISISLKGTQKTEINIEVESEDGTESKTYTLEVYRVDSADWDDDDSDDDDDPDEDDQFYDEYNECWVDLTKYDEWGSVNGKPAYFDKKSRQVKDAWIYTGGKYYYLNNLGYRASGWKVDDADGKTYYLDPKTGELKKGWMNLNNGWYYLGLNGVMHKGWLNLNQKWYYFTPNGQMVTNQTMYVDGQLYKFGQDGAIY